MKKTNSFSIKNIFLIGLKTIIPLALTFAIVIWTFQAIESFFGYFIKEWVGTTYYFPGLGALIGLVFVFIIGIVMNIWIAQKIYAIGDRLIKKIPLIKTVYSSIYDMMNFFDTGPKNPDQKKSVKVKLPIGNFIGLITRENFENLPEGIGSKKEVAVYIPMSYQIGGFTVIVPKDQLEFLDMPVQQAMSFALTAGIAGESKNPKPIKNK